MTIPMSMLKYPIINPSVVSTNYVITCKARTHSINYEKFSNNQQNPLAYQRFHFWILNIVIITKKQQHAQKLPELSTKYTSG